MIRTTLLSLLALCAVVLSACGSPAPAAEPTIAPQPAKQEPTQAAAPQDPAPAPPADGPAQVVITLADNTIHSDTTSFKAGGAYTFIITNNGRHEHNFNISPPVEVAGGYTEARSQALLAVDETQIPPGTTASVDFTFPAESAGSDLEFNCLIRRHYEDGMRLDIIVTS